MSGSLSVILSDTNRRVMAFRFIFDLGLFITATIFAFRLTAIHNADGGGKVPFLFDVYHLERGNMGANASEAISAIQGQSFANNLAIYTAVLPELGCFVNNGQPYNILSAACQECVQEYSQEILAYTSSLPDLVANTTEEIAEVATKLDYMGSCAMRTPARHSVHYMYKTNPWLQFVLWCGLAFSYTALSFWLSVNDQFSFAAATAFLVLGALGSIAIYFVLLFLPNVYDEWQYDLHFNVIQIVFTLVAYGLLFNKKGEYDGHTDKTFTLTFGIYTVAVAPSIAIIVAAFHTWLEYDMINYLVTLVTMFFVLCMIDDLFSVYWSKSGEDPKQLRRHENMHIYLIIPSLFLVASLATIPFPAAALGDKLFSVLLFSLFIVFAAIYTFIPTVLYEMSQRDTMQIVATKEIAELTLRVIFFCVLAHVYTYGVPA